MSEAKSGNDWDTGPGCRFAHPGYGFFRFDFQTTGHMQPQLRDLAAGYARVLP
jgi:hypothetical protein